MAARGSARMSGARGAGGAVAARAGVTVKRWVARTWPSAVTVTRQTPVGKSSLPGSASEKYPAVEPFVNASWSEASGMRTPSTDQSVRIVRSRGRGGPSNHRKMRPTSAGNCVAAPTGCLSSTPCAASMRVKRYVEDAALASTPTRSPDATRAISAVRRMASLRSVSCVAGTLRRNLARPTPRAAERPDRPPAHQTLRSYRVLHTHRPFLGRCSLHFGPRNGPARPQAHRSPAETHHPAAGRDGGNLHQCQDLPTEL